MNQTWENKKTLIVDPISVCLAQILASKNFWEILTLLVVGYYSNLSFNAI